MLVYTWLDPLRTSYSFGYGSFLVLGRTRPCSGGGCLCHHFASAAEPAAGQHSARQIIHNIRNGVRLRHRLALFEDIVLYTHTHTCNMPLPRLGFSSPRRRHFSTLCTCNWGPSRSYSYAWLSGGTTRGCCMQPDEA